MATEFAVILENRPGTLARLATALGDAGGNVEAIAGMSREGNSRIQFVPNDPDATAQALDAAGISYSKREALIVKALDEPGTLGDVALVMATAGGQVVLGVDDLSGAVQVAGGMAVVASK
jgi:hypothetical protein